MASYKLRCSIFGHEKDVRCVTAAFSPENSIVSGSRDVTTRVWTPDSTGVDFLEAHRMTGHSNFVSCVCVTPPSDEYPQGLILTGSLDNSINAYTMQSDQPVYKLSGHNDTVCSIAAGKFGTIISGSWDKTAKVWLNQKCVMTLTGHEAAIWSVAIIPEGGAMLTASADRTIKKWQAGSCKVTFTGHTDCVRGLALLSTERFLSCANDYTIKLWAVDSPACLQTYQGHSSFIYCVAVLPNGEDFVSVSEDRTLRVWEGGECTQTITHPCESVWTTCALPNGDIATGGSDGTIRVFTRAAERVASPQEIATFEEQVSSSKIPQQVSGIKDNQLSDPDALNHPGQRDGQTLMVRMGATVEAHQWSAADSKWIKIGEVVGSDDKQQGSDGATLGKTSYLGKEYDYVFSIDIDDNRPQLKLPFNRDEDPWMAAHNFLERNDLSPQFLDQVANFIIQNADLQPKQQDVTVSDPFTGGSRYIPGSQAPAGGHPASTAPLTGGGSDPFTGGSRYIPTGQQNGNTVQTPQVNFVGGNEFFPKASYLTFDSVQQQGLMNKLKEFNTQVTPECRLSDMELAQVELLLSGSVSSEQLAVISKLLQWPPEYIFPALDTFRVVVKHASVSSHFFTSSSGAAFIAQLCSYVNGDAPVPTVITALRSLVNAFSQPTGVTYLLQEMDIVLTALATCKAVENKNIQIAVCSLLLNYAIAVRGTDDTEAKSHLLTVAAEVAKLELDPEACFRYLVFVGTLVSRDESSIAIAVSLDLGQYANKMCAVKQPPKVAQCATYLAKILNY